MPVRKPKSPPKSGSKGRKTSSKKKSSKPAARSSKKKQRSAPARTPGFWKTLSIDRRLDIIGVVLALTGLLTLLSLISAERSVLTGGLIRILGQVFGWGVYILPLGLIVIGVWLVLRNIESVPTISIERVTGVILLYFWLLTAMHAIIAAPELAEQAALDRAGGGYLGSVFERMLWLGLGSWGAIVAMTAWLLIGLALTLDVPIRELFKWVRPLVGRIRQEMARMAKHSSTVPDGIDVQANGYTPMQRPPVPVNVPQAGESQLGMPTTTSSGQPVIEWRLPAVGNILDEGSAPEVNEEFIQQRARLIEDTLASFGAPAQVVEISRGPTITQFGVEPLFVETRSGRTRVRVNKISGLADDLALALSAPRIRIQAPVPGRGFVGIEVPNEEMTLVALRDILESEIFQRKRSTSSLSFALGRDVAGLPQIAALDAMPHLLIAGTTGSGKSVCVNAILTSFLLHNSPDDLRLVLVDPKRVELTSYNGIPHLLAPVIVEVDRVVGALQWMTREMDKRYHSFAKIGARNIDDYNTRMELQSGKKLPYLVIVIDELADLMMIAPDETERTITRLAQLARATGIHMILATQRPSVDVVTGLIKANFPARVAFAVASNTDSRVILDQPGAERLLGRGDMLYQAPEAPSPVRLQGVFVSDPEIQRLVDFWRAQMGGASPYAAAGAPVDAPLPSGVPLKQQALWEEMRKEEELDPLFDEAVDLVRRQGRCSVSMLQRRLRIGYTRAARLVDVMEEKGIVSEPQGSTGVRDVLDYGPAAPPKDD
ncbi:MAG: DNA translocase FtsK 4TM domain-containing protein [Anaerolineales bacterium]